MANMCPPCAASVGGGPFSLAAGVAGIVVAALSLSGILSPHAASVATLATNVATLNLPGIVVSALGMHGVVSATVVSAVTIGTVGLMGVAGLCVGGRILWKQRHPPAPHSDDLRGDHRPE